MEGKEAAVLRDCKYNFFLWEIFFSGMTTLLGPLPRPWRRSLKPWALRTVLY